MGHYDDIRRVTDEEYYQQQRDEAAEYQTLLKDLASLVEGDAYLIMYHTQQLVVRNTMHGKMCYMRQVINELKENEI